MLLTILSIVLTSILTLLLLALYVKKTLPAILEDVALGVSGDISKALSDTFEGPNMKRAMSILGQKSGEVRADNALRNKVANKVVEQSPLLKKGLEFLDITPIEGLKVLNDPLLKPIIQTVYQGLQQGQGGLGSSTMPRRNNGTQVPNM